MAQPYVGEVRMFAGDFAPAGWMFCVGQLLPISENETLFNLIGTTFGGDGQSTFALPDLRGRIPIHVGDGFTLAETGGVEDVTLVETQIPAHNHPLLGTSNAASSTGPQNNLPAQPSFAAYRGSPVPYVPMATEMIGGTGGNRPHTNLQPYLCVSFIISLYGIFPSPT
jgi:microcystin-dependent protein